MARFDLTDFEGSVMRRWFLTRAGGVKRVDDRRVLNGILWRGRRGRIFQSVMVQWATFVSFKGASSTCGCKL
jgi:transposase